MEEVLEIVEIIAGIKANQEWACRALIDMYADRLVRVAYGILGDHQLAEDIIQDVFIKVFHKISQYHPERSFYAWIYKITVNECRNNMRKWYYKRLFFISDYWGQLQGKDKNPEETYLQNESDQELLHQIFSLKRIYREVLILYYYEDFSIKEISEILNINENTVKTRLSRGRQCLKTMLERREVFHYETSQCEHA